ncbi:molybdopterin molybdenumtransferase MoeA [Arachnia propionica]|uniref:Molybdopterin molybdenumtransferase n=2 Tax=Arachnia propionica TaxID=1750 RepID=A0A3P1T6X3_9ACTN|nr:molybdopterin molybdenumtransferase MoeA [Arachnia propionica]
MVGNMALFGRKKKAEPEVDEETKPILPPAPRADLNGLRRVADHVDYLLNLVHPLKPFGMAVIDAFDQVVCEDINSLINVPANSTSRVVGFAVRVSDLQDEDGKPVESLVLAKDVEHLGTGQAVRVGVGEAVPRGATAVLPEEFVEEKADRIEVVQAVAEGEYLRAAGEHLAIGERLLSKGDTLNERNIGMLAAAGIDRVLVRPKPRVVIVASGAELVEPGAELGHGESTDANSYLIAAAAKAVGATVFRVAVHGNDTQELKQAITDQLIRADLVISTTGGSREDYEAVAAAMSELGLVDAVEVAMSPGRTQTCGLIGEERVPMVMLPGNPVSAYVSFQVFVVPLLRRLMGADVHRRTVRAIAKGMLRSVKGQLHLLRGELIDDGRVRSVARVADPFAMAELNRSNALILLDERTEVVRPGEVVQCWVMGEF